MRGEVAAALRADGYDVSECADGATLYRQLEHRLAHRGAHRSVVIAQARLPGFGTFRILHSLRALDVSIPVILMTRLRDASLADVAEKAGASAVLIKPVDLRDLQWVVAELVDAIAASESLGPLEPTHELGGGSREAVEPSSH